MLIIFLIFQVNRLESNASCNSEMETTIKDTKEAVATEKEKVKELEDMVKERDCIVEELQLALEEAKGTSEIVEKQDSETKEKDQIREGELNTIRHLQEENKRLNQQLQQKECNSINRDSTGMASDMMVDVLNEKTRENSQLKKENERLMQNIGEEQRRANLLEESINDEAREKEHMSMTAVHKLSQIIKDKDMEIEAMSKKSDSLLTVLQSNADDSEKHIKEREDTSKILEAKLEECRKLRLDLEEKNAHQCPNKAVADNSNEIVIMKDRIHELERKLNLANIKNEMIKESRHIDHQQMKKLEFRKRFHSESFEGKDYIEPQGNDLLKNVEENVSNNPNAGASNNNALRDKEEKLLEMVKELKDKDESILRKEDELRTNHHKINSLELRLSEADKSLEYYRTEIEKSLANIKTLHEDKQSLLGDTDRLKLCLEEKGHDLEMARRNLQQLTEMLEEKSNNSE
jgi:hypothetical protein